MPYILRNETGNIYRISTRSVPGVEIIAHNHPEVVEFLKARGLDPQVVENALTELRRTDNEMARAIEDLILVLLRKNVIKMPDLPKEVQDRIAARTKLRAIIQEVYDRASS